MKTMARAALLLAMVVGGPAAAQAQVDSLNRAYDLERRGSYGPAVVAYRAVLKSRPGDVGAMLGLERSLQPLNRGSEIMPDLTAALAANPSSTALLGIAIRTYAAGGFPDSVRRAVDKWAEVAPGDEAPWREWGNALLLKRERTAARAAYLAGRQKLGKPDVLAPEMAQVLILEGSYGAAVDEWLLAINRLQGYRSSAVLTLRQAPAPQRTDVLKALDKAGSPEAKRIEAELMARWGDPLAAFDRLVAVLPPNPTEAIDLLRQFSEAMRGQTGAPYRRAMGRTLEAIAERTPGASGARLRLDAAQAYLDGGDRTSARRMLATLADAGDTPTSLNASASATLLRLLVDEGKIEDAERRLNDSRNVLPMEQQLEMTRRLALGWVRAGNLERAQALVRADSSVEGLALQGRLMLFSGDIAGAVTMLKAAGPFAGTREEATDRTALLALLQPIEADSLPALGAAFLALERGDTTRAVEGFTAVGKSLPPSHGGAEVTLLAGRVEAARGHAPAAEKLLRVAADSTAPGAAPAALLELGRLLAQSGRQNEAVPVLEQLILTYPRSALVPQARRALDEAKGAIPQ